ncbi:MAG: UbiX family flavin prenyltransferase [Gammaproteobacteria bacterium]|nr:UbiX family flavin prenyltransferase [Gammaproteobacteria bacterium]MDH5629702.1 UbiX family flavin prenyltransferase [Gammaproteobacteria bacterium]
MNEQSDQTEFNNPDNQITLGITGASGAIYGITLLSHLVKYYQQVHVMITDAARVVLATEMNINLPEAPVKIEAKLSEICQATKDQIKVYAKENWFSVVASGSSAPKQMVVCPASMGCVSSIATGASNTLMERAADVVLKEKGQLILVPREMPFSHIHLKNMLSLTESGATIMPAAPGFYHQPESIEDLINFVCGRVLNHLGIKDNLVECWGYKSS